MKPEEIVVEIATPEERWGIRCVTLRRSSLRKLLTFCGSLVNMLACLDMLMESGLCVAIPSSSRTPNPDLPTARDARLRDHPRPNCRRHHRTSPSAPRQPSSTTTFPQDELVRKPAPPSTPEPKRRRSRPPGSSTKRASPSTPSKGTRKKSRTTPESGQPALTSYFHAAVQVPEREDTPSAFAARAPAGTRHATPTIVDTEGEGEGGAPAWVLHISDTKTRRTASLPPEEDTLSARLQLMLYHRLLSNLLAPSPSPSTSTHEKHRAPAPLDFAALWTRLGLDAHRAFSTRFAQDAGLAPGACLADLVRAWHHTSAALGLRSGKCGGGVDGTLTLVYRLQPAAARRLREQEKEKEREKEREELARAIEASLNAAPRAWEGGDEDLARAIEESLREATSGKTGNAIGATLPDTLTPGPEELDTSQTVPQEPGATQESEASPAARGEDDGGEDEVHLTAAELAVEARILGTKAFAVDDEALDGYLDSVLEWWLGARAPRGVDVALTRRCLCVVPLLLVAQRGFVLTFVCGMCRTCEYVDGCEWRAQKALEHQRQQGTQQAW